MQFLKTLFWVLIAVVSVLFGVNNWTAAQVNLWGNMVWETKLPFLLLIAFLIGFLPTWGLMRTRLWSHRRRIDAMERNRVASLPGDVAVEEQDSGA
jgi:uncharacterized integral membrane protein